MLVLDSPVVDYKEAQMSEAANKPDIVVGVDGFR